MSTEAGAPRVLLLDNRDSFVHIVARYLRELGARTEVLRSDRVTVAEVWEWNPTHLVVSPGPCTPREAGVSTEVIRSARGDLPILGICLGHQCVAVAFGGRVVSARDPAHGRDSPIQHSGVGVLKGLPSPFPAARYHSLAVDRARLPASLQVEGETQDGEIMVLRHLERPVWGVQFHPESVLTPVGRMILGAFLELPGRTPEAASQGGDG